VRSRSLLEELFWIGLKAVGGRNAVATALRSSSWPIGPAPIVLLAAGKAAPAMVSGALDVLGSRVTKGFGVCRDEPDHRIGPVELVRAGHPHPDARSERAAARALELAQACTSGARLLVLLSGGASALWAAPVAGVPLSEKRRLSEALMRAGVSIEALNAVRKHLSRIKGGGLLRSTAAQSVYTLAISDVIGDSPSVIGSGPSVADESTFADALRVIERAGLTGVAPICDAYLTEGARGLRPETLDPRDAAAYRTHFQIVASLETAMAAIEAECARRELRVWRRRDRLGGEVRSLAPSLYREILSAQEGGFDLVLAGGEPTVSVCGSGRGGRAQELALALALQLEAGSTVVGLAAGTDGSDGPTPAAGAWFDEECVRRAQKAGIDAHSALDQNDSYCFHRAAGSTFCTGPTGTNVTDLLLVGLRPLGLSASTQ